MKNIILNQRKERDGLVVLNIWMSLRILEV